MAQITESEINVVTNAIAYTIEATLSGDFDEQKNIKVSSEVIALYRKAAKRAIESLDTHRQMNGEYR